MSPSPALDAPSRHRRAVAALLRRRSGLTLVELLTSMMVASVIMVALLQSLTSASDSWTRQSKHFSSQREGRVAMRLLADDLAAMVLVPHPARSAADSAPGLVVIPDIDLQQPPGLGEPRTGFMLETAANSLDSARLAFLRATQTRERDAEHGGGDLRLVMYGLAFSTDGGASGTAPNAMSQKLVRRVFSAAETYRRLKLHLQNQTPLVRSSDWQSLSELRDESSVSETGVIAHDVIRFDLRPFTDLARPDAAQNLPPSQPPNWLDMTLRVTNRQTGQHLQTQNDWLGTGMRDLHNGTRDDYQDDPEVRTYTTRLRLPSSIL